ncbi:ATP-dependent 3'-5' DNA helicase [Ascoidea rubescens DSM 1968]|uniref:Putative DNA helicase n=1 Tax=Ascoidea rubescens DSM 1968 TaxID=1344418 RepID=A0A1D2VLF1_9ASCO|nr:putative DNA helicase [Ascoidea rubescens DSM 1968]ODV62448.1 putative DNA helicase [Ascoidea rubescens DSM 1968]
MENKRKRSFESQRPSRPSKKLDLAEGVWPESFRELELIYFHLNTFYTFLSAKKNTVTSFDTVKVPAEKQIKRKLTHIDVCKLIALLPNHTLFRYVDKSQLSLLEEKQFDNHGFVQKESDIFKLEDLEDEDEAKNQVLLFEFTDSTPNQKKVKSSFYSNTPIYTTEQIKRLIDKRKKLFEEAVNRFLEKCSKDEDPMERLTENAKIHLPKLNTFIDPIQAMLENQNENEQSNSLDERCSIPEMIDLLKKSSFYKHQIVSNGEFHFPERTPMYSSLNFELSPKLIKALHDVKSVREFYSHQAKAINAIHQEKNVIITTSTSSGKSLIYQIPVLNNLIESKKETKDLETAIYIFPTKALAQDQKRSLSELIEAIPSLARNILVETFDGDTPKNKRSYIRENAHIIFTNPDTIHWSILPNNENWSSFLKRLKYIVVDELHIYNGLFGSHVGLVMRRLIRICNYIGNNNIIFISCSATLKTPIKHMSTLFGLSESKDSICHISKDGSPSGEKYLIAWNPILVNKNNHEHKRESFIVESARILIELVKNNFRVISFCVVREVCELLMKEVRYQLKEINRSDLIEKIMAYRGGYSASDRREIEFQMFNQNLKAIIATNALELGIDIGSLDVVLNCGFPISLANFKQQSGRAGRRNKDSMTLFVGSNDPVNQFYMKDPNKLISNNYQELVLDFKNLVILESHIQCAAFELPINIETDSRIFFGEEFLEKICEKSLRKDDYGYNTSEKYLPWPSSFVNLRGDFEDKFAVVDVTNGRNIVIEEIEKTRTTFTLYDGGIFIHQGLPYLIKEFNPEEFYAKVIRVNVDWRTNQRDYTDVDPIEVEKAIKADCPIYFGKVKITMVVFGFFKVDKKNRILDAVQVTNPPVIIDTKGFWINVPKEAISMVRKKELSLAGGIHGAQHCIANLFPLIIFSGKDDIFSECKAPEKEFANRQTSRQRPARLIFCDFKGGVYGSGLCEKAFENIEEILEESLKRIIECDCEYGCPECIASGSCKESSLVLSKPAAVIILSVICGYEIDLDSIPKGPEINMPLIKTETIVASGDIIKRNKKFEVVEPKKDCRIMKMNKGKIVYKRNKKESEIVGNGFGSDEFESDPFGDDDDDEFF